MQMMIKKYTLIQKYLKQACFLLAVHWQYLTWLDFNRLITLLLLLLLSLLTFLIFKLNYYDNCKELNE